MADNKITTFLKNLTPEQIEDMAKSMAESMEAHYKDLEAFSKTSRFQEIVSKIKAIVGADGVLSDNVYQEPLFEDVSNEEFVKVFSVVFTEELSKVPVQTEKDAVFATEFVIFEGMKFLEIHGQGTAFIVQGLSFKPQED